VGGSAGISEGADAAFAAIQRHLVEGPGLDLSRYKPTYLRRRLLVRVRALRLSGLDAYARHLKRHPEEIAQELRMEWRGEDLLRDPTANIAMGTYYLTKLLGQFEDMAVALTAYNHGPGRVAEMEESRATLPMDYAEKVLSYYTP